MKSMKQMNRAACWQTSSTDHSILKFKDSWRALSVPITKSRSDVASTKTGAVQASCELNVMTNDLILSQRPPSATKEDACVVGRLDFPLFVKFYL